MSSVKAALTVNPRTRAARTDAPAVVENGPYFAFCGRIIRAAGRRVAAADIEALADLHRLGAQIDDALAGAVAGLRAAGYSWADIADRLGTTKQAAHDRWAGGSC